MNVFEKIKNNQLFSTIIDGNKYDAYVYYTYSGLHKSIIDISTIYNLVIRKKTSINILGFNIPKIEWEYEYMIGYNEFRKSSINVERVGGCEYYEISDVKRWCYDAIEHRNKAIQKRNKEIEMEKKIIHKSLI